MAESLKKDKGLFENPLDINPLQRLSQVLIYSISSSFMLSYIQVGLLSIPIFILFLFYRKAKVFLLIFPFLIFFIITSIFNFSSTFILTSVKIILPVLYSYMILSRGKYHTVRTLGKILKKLGLRYAGEIVCGTIEYIKDRSEEEPVLYHRWDFPQLLFLTVISITGIVIFTD